MTFVFTFLKDYVQDFGRRDLSKYSKSADVAQVDEDVRVGQKNHAPSPYAGSVR